MLVLSRHRDESIIASAYNQAGEPIDIHVTVVEIRGDKVRLGIDAPKEVPVHRREVYDAIQRAQAEQKTAEDAKSAEGS